MTAIRKVPTPDPDDSGSYEDDNGTVVSFNWAARESNRRPAPPPIPRWGVVTAKPSEYLIHVRRGQIRRRTTGQGASCFKWPWDSVALVPTTISRLQFTADQVTREKVGLQVSGLAVYRIVSPELTFRMLNFSQGSRAIDELDEILREMFVGATRRHVANLTVEQVMTQRKDAIAVELMRELTPVLDGTGRSDDATVCGWGVVLDTVEIQNVQVLSERVFGDMQASFRAELAAQARQAQLDSARAIAMTEASSKREIEAARLEAERAGREMRATSETQAHEIEVSQQSRRDELAARAEEETIARDKARKLLSMQAQAELENAQAQRVEDKRMAQLDREQRLAVSEGELAAVRHEQMLQTVARDSDVRRRKQQVAHMLEEAQSQLQAALTKRELGLKRMRGDLRNDMAAARKRIKNSISEDRIRLAAIEKALPAIAEALSPDIGELKVTQIGAGDDPMATVSKGLAQLSDFARSLGVSLPSPRGPRTEIKDD